MVAAAPAPGRAEEEEETRPLPSSDGRPDPESAGAAPPRGGLITTKRLISLKLSSIVLSIACANVLAASPMDVKAARPWLLRAWMSFESEGFFEALLVVAEGGDVKSGACSDTSRVTPRAVFAAVVVHALHEFHESAFASSSRRGERRLNFFPGEPSSGFADTVLVTSASRRAPSLP